MIRWCRNNIYYSWVGCFILSSKIMSGWVVSHPSYLILTMNSNIINIHYVHKERYKVYWKVHYYYDCCDEAVLPNMYYSVMIGIIPLARLGSCFPHNRPPKSFSASLSQHPSSPDIGYPVQSTNTPQWFSMFPSAPGAHINASTNLIQFLQSEEIISFSLDPALPSALCCPVVMVKLHVNIINHELVFSSFSCTK